MSMVCAHRMAQMDQGFLSERIQLVALAIIAEPEIAVQSCPDKVSE